MDQHKDSGKADTVAMKALVMTLQGKESYIFSKLSEELYRLAIKMLKLAWCSIIWLCGKADTVAMKILVMTLQGKEIYMYSKFNKGAVGWQWNLCTHWKS